MGHRRITLFGGTFDPVHLGHTTVADAAARQIEAQEVVFIPAKCSPLKGFSPNANDDDRLEMILRATADNDSFAVSNCELKRPAPSYTLDTVRQFKQRYGPDTHVHWLLGADSLPDLVHWYRIRELIDECNITTMQRAGYPAPDFERLASIWGTERTAKLKRDVVETPLVDISSTEIRKRLAQGGDVSGMMHPDVIAYIREHNLYSGRQS